MQESPPPDLLLICNVDSDDLLYSSFSKLLDLRPEECVVSPVERVVEPTLDIGLELCDGDSDSSLGEVSEKEEECCKHGTLTRNLSRNIPEKPSVSSKGLCVPVVEKGLCVVEKGLSVLEKGDMLKTELSKFTACCRRPDSYIRAIRQVIKVN